MTKPSIEIPPEPKLPYRLWYPALEHHATALGYVCMTYAGLEMVINNMIGQMLGCSTEDRRSIVDATGTTIGNRCALLLKLARPRSPSEQWFVDLDDILKRVQGEIAEDRNRLIHDPWVQGEEITQWNDKIYVQPPQTGQPKALTPPKMPKRPLPSVWDLVRRIQELTSYLTHLVFDFAIWQQKGRPPEPQPLPEWVRIGSAQAAQNQAAQQAQQPPPLPSGA